MKIQKLLNQAGLYSAAVLFLASGAFAQQNGPDAGVQQPSEPTERQAECIRGCFVGGERVQELSRACIANCLNLPRDTGHFP